METDAVNTKPSSLLTLTAGDARMEVPERNKETPGIILKSNSLTLLYLKWITNKDDGIVQGTLLNFTEQPKWIRTWKRFSSVQSLSLV